MSYKQYLLNAPGDEAAYIALLEKGGYARRTPWSGGGAGTYEIELDVEPRRGIQTLILTVFEDAANPMLEKVDALARELNPPRS